MHFRAADSLAPTLQRELLVEAHIRKLPKGTRVTCFCRVDYCLVAAALALCRRKMDTALPSLDPRPLLAFLSPTGSHAQIMKQGYFVVDVPAGSGEGGGVVLIQTPDGHASDTEAARQTSQEE